MKLAGEKTNRR